MKKGSEGENALFLQLFFKMCPTVPWKAYIFLKNLFFNLITVLSPRLYSLLIVLIGTP